MVGYDCPSKDLFRGAQYSSPMHPRTRLGLLVGGLVLVGVFVLASPIANQNPGEVGEPTRTEETVRFVQPAQNGTVELWPFTSRAESFDRATLPINVVVREDAATVRRILTNERSGTPRENDSEWETRMPEREHDEPAGIEWGRGHGANRYTYVRTSGGGQWMAQADQLRDGSYFGSQYHLRIYTPASTNRWTAIQAHHEHWDWFRLRHSVGSVSSAQHHVERDLMDKRVVADVSRERYANGGAVDADGWVTVADLRPNVARGVEPDSGARGTRSPSNVAPLGLPVLGLVLAAHVRVNAEATGVFGRLTRYHLALFASTAMLMPLVRAGGIAVEQLLPGVSPWVVGAPFFLLLVLGYPALAVLFGRHLPAEDGFATAALGMGVGILADYAYLEVTALPYDAVTQRFLLLLGLGLIAAGGTRWAEEPLRRHKYRLVGLAVWFGFIVKPLLGL